MKNIRVGIITLAGNFNYGNRLQCYAMARLVERVGCIPFVLEKEQQFSLPRRAYYAIKKAACVLLGKGPSSNAEKNRTPERAAAFRRFGRNIPTVILPGMGRSARDSYDYFIVGSDQVWNPEGIRHQEPWFFAKFTRPEQRIAVAASLGIDSFADSKQSERVAGGVSGFAHVSVREKRGAELIKECSDIDAKVICDPTLVLSSDDWRTVADGRCTPEKPYVFTYLLGGLGTEAADVLEMVTDHGRIPVVPLSDRQKPGEPDAGPAEFIDLIDNAAHVVTDSFHAAVFSSILHTPLTIVHREGGASMFSRLEQLSQMLGIEEKVYGTPEYDLTRAGEYKGVDEAIACEREKFMGYLEGCFER
ncbi:polysaccharide pyruvyl transferase family protein [Collinsella sp. HCP3S3_E6]|uniref:polysaccharide pyruvyl transferase family protein n=1 Tax=unclassified Collinsella TaxID=2637548 RepID=UPI003F8CAF0F